MAWKIKTGDHVYVVSGDEKGTKGKVLKVDHQKSRVFVEGVNVRSRHVKPSPAHPEGGVVSKELSIHYSNVAIVDPDSQESLNWTKRLTSRVGFRMTDAGKKVRYDKRSQKDLD